MNFSIEESKKEKKKESKEDDLIIKAATGNIKTRTIRNLQAVGINNQGAPLLGLAKSIYYIDLANLRRKEELPFLSYQGISIG